MQLQVPRWASVRSRRDATEGDEAQATLTPDDPPSLDIYDLPQYGRMASQLPGGPCPDADMTPYSGSR